MRQTTGPKISSLAMVMSRLDVREERGPDPVALGMPATLSCRPSTTSFAPSATPLSMYARTFSRCRALMTGPMVTPGSMP